MLREWVSHSIEKAFDISSTFAIRSRINFPVRASWVRARWFIKDLILCVCLLCPWHEAKDLFGQSLFGLPKPPFCPNENVVMD